MLNNNADEMDAGNHADALAEEEDIPHPGTRDHSGAPAELFRPCSMSA